MNEKMDILTRECNTKLEVALRDNVDKLSRLSKDYNEKLSAAIKEKDLKLDQKDRDCINRLGSIQ